MPALRFLYDVTCPYAWIAFTQVEAMHLAGVEVVLEPVLLGGILRAVGSPDFPGSVLVPNKARLNMLDATRQADMLGVEQAWHPRHPVRSLDAMRLLTQTSGEQRWRVTRALFEAVHVRHLDLDKPDVLAGVAAALGLDVGLASLQESKDALRAATDAAVAAGAFGVPTFLVGGQMWWGADRLPLVRVALGLPAKPEVLGPERGAEIELFHDVSSPYSYLGFTQVQALAERVGATLILRPMLLGALFREIGTEGIPMAAMVPARQRYTARDMADWAAYRGVPFRFTPHFPLRSVNAQRVQLVEPKSVAALYQAAWVDGVNLSEPAELVRVLDEAGFDGQALLAATSDQSVKDALRENTERAAQLGACGAPTWLVNGHLFWGQDRLDQVAAAATGWVPPESRA